jgi:hypothetical protein
MPEPRSLESNQHSGLQRRYVPEHLAAWLPAFPESVRLPPLVCCW